MIHKGATEITENRMAWRVLFWSDTCFILTFDSWRLTLSISWQWFGKIYLNCTQVPVSGQCMCSIASLNTAGSFLRHKDDQRRLKIPLWTAIGPLGSTSSHVPPNVFEFWNMVPSCSTYHLFNIIMRLIIPFSQISMGHQSAIQMQHSSSGQCLSLPPLKLTPSQLTCKLHMLNVRTILMRWMRWDALSSLLLPHIAWHFQLFEVA